LTSVAGVRGNWSIGSIRRARVITKLQRENNGEYTHISLFGQ
jgi:hypothetical protein